MLPPALTGWSPIAYHQRQQLMSAIVSHRAVDLARGVSETHESNLRGEGLLGHEGVMRKSGDDD
jgi:hypothetical protein